MSLSMDHSLAMKARFSGLISSGMLEQRPRQVFTTYEDETLGVELIPRIRTDNVMWASDHPHGDVTCENAARVYGFQT